MKTIFRSCQYRKCTYLCSVIKSMYKTVYGGKGSPNNSNAFLFINWEE